MIYLSRGNTSMQYTAGISKGGHVKRNNSRDTFTICCTNQGGVFRSCFCVLVTKTKDESIFSTEAKRKLTKLGLSEAKNEGSSVPFWIYASNNGWMQQYHLPLLLETEKENGVDYTAAETPWRLKTQDGWIPWVLGGHYRDMLLSAKTVQVLTPPGLSSIYNWLDVHSHAHIKAYQSKDNARDSIDPLLSEYFVTSSGVLKAGSQYLTASNVFKRLNSTLNDEKYRPGYIRDWHRVGYGLPIDSSEKDNLFLQHLFGFEVGGDAADDHNIINGIDPTVSSAAKVATTRIKPGRKRMLAGFGKCDKRKKVRIVKEASNSILSGSADPRITFLKRWKQISLKFADHVRERYNFTSPQSFYKLKIHRQQAVMRYLTISMEWKKFDIHTSEGDAAPKPTRNAVATQMALRSMQHTTTNTTLSEVLSVLSRETAKADEEDIQRKNLTEITSLVVANQKAVLRALGLPTTGLKADLTKRLVDNAHLALPIIMDMKKTVARTSATAVYKEFPFCEPFNDQMFRITWFKSSARLPVIDFITAALELGKHITLDLGFELYGGYPRDVIGVGQVHTHLDLDVHTKPGMSHKRIHKQLQDWCKEKKLIVNDMVSEGQHVCRHDIRTPQGRILQVQSIVASGFANTGVDFDSNALALVDGDLQIRSDLQSDNRLSLHRIKDQCENKLFKLMKSEALVAERMQKMFDRGWTVLG